MQLSPAQSGLRPLRGGQRPEPRASLVRTVRTPPRASDHPVRRDMQASLGRRNAGPRMYLRACDTPTRNVGKPMRESQDSGTTSTISAGVAGIYSSTRQSKVVSFFYFRCSNACSGRYRRRMRTPAQDPAKPFPVGSRGTACTTARLAGMRRISRSRFPRRRGSGGAGERA